MTQKEKRSKLLAPILVLCMLCLSNASKAASDKTLSYYHLALAAVVVADDMAPDFEGGFNLQQQLWDTASRLSMAADRNERKAVAMEFLSASFGDKVEELKQLQRAQLLKNQDALVDRAKGAALGFVAGLKGKGISELKPSSLLEIKKKVDPRQVGIGTFAQIVFAGAKGAYEGQKKGDHAEFERLISEVFFTRLALEHDVVVLEEERVDWLQSRHLDQNFCGNFVKKPTEGPQEES